MIERFEDRWTQYRWRLIRGEPVAAPVNHAIDEVLTRAAGSGERAPTLRFWDRLQPEVVIGRFQSVRNEVDEDAAREFDIPITRRITGGGAMYVEVPNVITYSLYVPLDLVAGMSFVESYAFLDHWVIRALQSLGIDAWYEPINDITSSGGKIGGAAQARRFGASHRQGEAERQGDHQRRQARRSAPPANATATPDDYRAHDRRVQDVLRPHRRSTLRR
jgi:lipoate---protein ligase